MGLMTCVFPVPPSYNQSFQQCCSVWGVPPVSTRLHDGWRRDDLVEAVSCICGSVFCIRFSQIKYNQLGWKIVSAFFDLASEDLIAWLALGGWQGQGLALEASFIYWWQLAESCHPLHFCSAPDSGPRLAPMCSRHPGLTAATAHYTLTLHYCHVCWAFMSIRHLSHLCPSLCSVSPDLSHIPTFRNLNARIPQIRVCIE